jgi:hypothetical protein
MIAPWTIRSRSSRVRDAKAIRGGIALTGIALVIGVIGLFTGPIAGFVALLAAGLVQLNVLYAWLAGPRLMAAAGPFLPRAYLQESPWRWAGTRCSAGVGAIICSLPRRALATIVLGMTIAARRAA